MRAKRCDAENIKRRLKEAKKQQTLANRRKQEADDRVAELQEKYAALALGEQSESSESSEDSEPFFEKGAYVARKKRTPEELKSNKTIPGVILREKQDGLYLTQFIGKSGSGNYKPTNLRLCSEPEARKYKKKLKELEVHIKW